MTADPARPIAAEAEAEAEADEALLDRLQRRAFDYFLRAYNPSNGLIADTTRAGSPSSIAVTSTTPDAKLPSTDLNVSPFDQGGPMLDNVSFWVASAPVSAASAASCASRRAVTTNFAPRLESSLAIAWPRPPLAPVTMILLPRISITRAPRSPGLPGKA